jgi:hypothetical protein
MLDMKFQNDIIVQYTAQSHWIPAFAGMTRKWDSNGVSPL